MPYEPTEHIIRQMSPYLEELAGAGGKPVAWEVEVGESHKFAVQLRAALFSAAHESFADDFPTFAPLFALYTVSVRNDKTILARPRAPGAIKAKLVAIGNTPAEADTVAATVHKPRASAVVSTIPAPVHRSKAVEVKGEFEYLRIVHEWSAHPEAYKLSFPHTTLDRGELNKLARWAVKQTPMVFVVADENLPGVTLTVDEEVEMIAWEVTE